MLQLYMDTPMRRVYVQDCFCVLLSSAYFFLCLPTLYAAHLYPLICKNFSRIYAGDVFIHLTAAR